MQNNCKNKLSFGPRTPSPIGDRLQRWRVEVNIYKEMPNPVWEISAKLVKQLITLAKHLPGFNEGIPVCDTTDCTGCVIFNREKKLLSASKGIVVLIEDKIIRIKKDEDREIENKILSSAPNKVYREICGYI